MCISTKASKHQNDMPRDLTYVDRDRWMKRISSDSKKSTRSLAWMKMRTWWRRQRRGRLRLETERMLVLSSISIMSQLILMLGQVNGKAKKAKAEPAPPPANTAIYVTSLPLDVEFDEVAQVFKRFGLLAENFETNMPRIKLYKDDNGEFKGDALIVYNRPESVRMAIMMADGTDFRIGQKLDSGPMSVTEADASYKVQKEQPLAAEGAKKKGTTANKDRQKIIKKNEEMKRYAMRWHCLICNERGVDFL
jgi:hypothetical protein